MKAAAKLPRQQVTQALAAERSLGEVVKRPQARPVQHGAALLNRALAQLLERLGLERRQGPRSTFD